MTTILLLNGPPGSGKDMAATFIRKDIGADKCVDHKTKRPLVDIFQAMFALTDMQVHNMCETPQKDVAQEMLGGITPRECLIDISERFIKPKYGERFLGETLARRINLSSGIFATVSDTGFTEEVYPLIKRFGHTNLFCIQLLREGYSFENDSRSYIDCDRLGIRSIRIDNRFELEMFRIQIWRALKWIPLFQAKLEAL